jgi:hypothetical protein
MSAPFCKEVQPLMSTDIQEWRLLEIDPCLFVAEGSILLADGLLLAFGNPRSQKRTHKDPRSAGPTKLDQQKQRFSQTH